MVQRNLFIAKIATLLKESEMNLLNSNFSLKNLESDVNLFMVSKSNSVSKLNKTSDHYRFLLNHFIKPIVKNVSKNMSQYTSSLDSLINTMEINQSLLANNNYSILAEMIFVKNIEKNISKEIRPYLFFCNSFSELANLKQVQNSYSSLNDDFRYKPLMDFINNPMDYKQNFLNGESISEIIDRKVSSEVIKYNIIDSFNENYSKYTSLNQIRSSQEKIFLEMSIAKLNSIIDTLDINLKEDLESKLKIIDNNINDFDNLLKALKSDFNEVNGKYRQLFNADLNLDSDLFNNCNNIIDNYVQLFNLSDISKFKKFEEDLSEEFKENEKLDKSIKNKLKEELNKNLENLDSYIYRQLETDQLTSPHGIDELLNLHKSKLDLQNYLKPLILNKLTQFSSDVNLIESYYKSISMPDKNNCLSQLIFQNKSLDSIFESFCNYNSNVNSYVKKFKVIRKDRYRSFFNNRIKVMDKLSEDFINKLSKINSFIEIYNEVCKNRIYSSSDNQRIRNSVKNSDKIVNSVEGKYKEDLESKLKFINEQFDLFDSKIKGFKEELRDSTDKYKSLYDSFVDLSSDNVLNLEKIAKFLFNAFKEFSLRKYDSFKPDLEIELMGCKNILNNIETKSKDNIDQVFGDLEIKILGELKKDNKQTLNRFNSLQIKQYSISDNKIMEHLLLKKFESSKKDLQIIVNYLNSINSVDKNSALFDKFSSYLSKDISNMNSINFDEIFQSFFDFDRNIKLNIKELKVYDKIKVTNFFQEYINNQDNKYSDLLKKPINNFFSEIKTFILNNRNLFSERINIGSFKKLGLLEKHISESLINSLNSLSKNVDSYSSKSSLNLNGFLEIKNIVKDYDLYLYNLNRFVKSFDEDISKIIEELKDKDKQLKRFQNRANNSLGTYNDQFTNFIDGLPEQIMNHKTILSLVRKYSHFFDFKNDQLIKYDNNSLNLTFFFELGSDHLRDIKKINYLSSDLIKKYAELNLILTTFSTPYSFFSQNIFDENGIFDNNFKLRQKSKNLDINNINIESSDNKILYDSFLQNYTNIYRQFYTKQVSKAQDHCEILKSDFRSKIQAKLNFLHLFLGRFGDELYSNTVNSGIKGISSRISRINKIFPDENNFSSRISLSTEYLDGGISKMFRYVFWGLTPAIYTFNLLFPPIEESEHVRKIKAILSANKETLSMTEQKLSPLEHTIASEVEKKTNLNNLEEEGFKFIKEYKDSNLFNEEDESHIINDLVELKKKYALSGSKGFISKEKENSSKQEESLEILIRPEPLVASHKDNADVNDEIIIIESPKQETILEISTLEKLSNIVPKINSNNGGENNDSDVIIEPSKHSDVNDVSRHLDADVLNPEAPLINILIELDVDDSVENGEEINSIIDDKEVLDKDYSYLISDDQINSDSDKNLNEVVVSQKIEKSDSYDELYKLIKNPSSKDEKSKETELDFDKQFGPKFGYLKDVKKELDERGELNQNHNWYNTFFSSTKNEVELNSSIINYNPELKYNMAEDFIDNAEIPKTNQKKISKSKIIASNDKSYVSTLRDYFSKSKGIEYTKKLFNNPARFIFDKSKKNKSSGEDEINNFLMVLNQGYYIVNHVDSILGPYSRTIKRLSTKIPVLKDLKPNIAKSSDGQKIIFLDLNLTKSDMEELLKQVQEASRFISPYYVEVGFKK